MTRRAARGVSRLGRIGMLAVLALTLSSGANGRLQAQRGKSPDPTPDVAGHWTLSIDMNVGVAKPTIEIKQNGQTITGTYRGRYGDFPIVGSLDGRGIAFSFTMKGGRRISFTGEVAANGQTMRGEAEMAEMGDATWAATREK